MIRLAAPAAMVLSLAACADPPEWSIDGDTATTTVLVDTINTIDSGRKAKWALPHAPEANEVRIVFRAITKDRLGNEGDAPLYTLTFDGKDIARANFDNLDTWETLDLATAIRIDSGQGAVLLAQNCDVQPRLCRLEPDIG